MSLLADRSLQSEPQSKKAVLRRYCVSAAVDPSSLARVIEQFVLRDLVPSRISSRLVEGTDPELRIDVDVAGLEDQEAEHVARKLGQFPCVLRVLMDRAGAL